MNNLSFQNAETQAVGMWNRPGGKIKSLLLLAGAAIGIYFLSPFLIKVLNDTTELAWGITKGTFAIGGMIAAVLIVYFLLTNKKLKYLLMGIWDILMDYTVGMVVTWNPQVLAREGVKEEFKNVEKLKSDVDAVAGKEEQTKNDLDKNAARLNKIDEEQNALRSLTPQALSNRGLEPEDVAYQISTLETEKSGLQDWNSQLEPVYNDIKTARIGLNQLTKYAEYQAKVHEQQVELEIKKYESLSAASNAARRFMSILNGNGDKAFMAEKAMSFMQQRMAKDRADFKQVVRRSQDFVKSINLKEAIYDKSALEYLNTFKLKYEQNNPGQLTSSPATFRSAEEKTANKNYTDLIQ